MGAAATCQSLEANTPTPQLTTMPPKKPSTKTRDPSIGKEDKCRKKELNSSQNSKSIFKRTFSRNEQDTEALNCSLCDVKHCPQNTEQIFGNNIIPQTGSEVQDCEFETNSPGRKLCRKKSETKKGKQSLFPYPDQSYKSCVDELPKTPSSYHAVNNWEVFPVEEKDPTRSEQLIEDVAQGNDEISSPFSNPQESLAGAEGGHDDQVERNLIPPHLELHEASESASSSCSDSSCNIMIENPGESSLGSSSTHSLSEVASPSQMTNDDEKGDDRNEGGEDIKPLEHEPHLMDLEDSRHEITTTHECRDKQSVQVTGTESRSSSDINFTSLHDARQNDTLRIQDDVELDGVITLMDSLKNVDFTDDIKYNCGHESHDALCHVCSDESYRDALAEIIREETPDRLDLVTSILQDEYNFQRLNDDDCSSLDVNYRDSPDTTVNICSLCHTNVDDYVTKYRIVEVIELTKYAKSTMKQKIDRLIDHSQGLDNTIKCSIRQSCCFEYTKPSSRGSRPALLVVLLLDEDDVLSEVSSSKAVPEEVKEWLASTFTRNNTSNKRRSEEKPKFRTVANAIRAGITVDKIYRRLCAATLIQIPVHIAEILKGVDNWSFDVFALSEASNGQVLKYLGYDILNRYGFVHKFKIPQRKLDKFLDEMEVGYTKFKNPYHNNLHAADVTQTVHYILYHLGFASWLTDLEIFATIIAAIIHDFQHTGTTNNFHVMSGSDTAILYNDRAVLENFHVSSAFKIILTEDANILQNLSKDEYREFRNLVIEMVLATDMSSHFQQIKTMKSLLSQNDLMVDKGKALSLVIHCCDISHPAKQFDIHQKWTGLLMEEFFRQGDKEKELGLPYSPLCDRNTTLVAESQIGFIDFIVAPSMEVCGELLDKVYLHNIGALPKSTTNKEAVKPVPRSAPETNPATKDTSAGNLGRPKSVSCINELPSNKANAQEEKTEQKLEKCNLDKPEQRSIKSAPPPKSPSSSSTSSSSSKYHSEMAKHVDSDGKIIRPWMACLDSNKSLWKDRAEEALVSAVANKGSPPPPPPRPGSSLKQQPTSTTSEATSPDSRL